MARGMYDNSWNRNRTRIDTRNQSDPAVQAGMRKIHRGMDGRVIGGVTAEGQGIGTRSTQSNPFADMPDRPSLDSISASVAGGAQSGHGTAPAAAPAVGAAGSPSSALSGGLSRWERLNPNARKAFGAGSPANSKSENRRLAQRIGKKAAPGFTNTPLLASMPPARTWAQMTELPAQRTGLRKPKAAGMTMEEGNAEFDVTSAMQNPRFKAPSVARR